jgi:gluconolactonase
MKIEKVADLPFYTEGPAIDSIGNIYYTTLSGGSILKMDGQGEITEWALSACPNGQIVLPGGDHLICDVQLGAIRRFDAHGRYIRDEIRGNCAGIELYSPSDLIADSDQNIYFTDTIRHKGKVCFLGADGQQRILLDNLDCPNGLVLSADQKMLYVAESYKNRVIKIDLVSTGWAKGDAEALAGLPGHPSGREQDNLPDGVTLDDNGNLWVAHYGMQAIHKLSPGGALLLSIDTTLPFTSNLVFANKHTLIVTGGYGEPSPGALFKIYL